MPSHEAEFAWPPDNRPPYPPLRQRVLRAALLQTTAIAILLVALQVFTPEEYAGQSRG